MDEKYFIINNINIYEFYILVDQYCFQFIQIIGKGGFGKVWKVMDKKSKKIYALKEMRKVRVIDKRSVKNINHEKEILSKINHPFIVNMHYSFQDYDNLYLVMDFLSGGDLRYHLSRKKRFNEEQTSKKYIYLITF
jgi:serine/threonine protein kinase